MPLLSEGFLSILLNLLCELIIDLYGLLRVWLLHYLLFNDLWFLPFHRLIQLELDSLGPVWFLRLLCLSHGLVSLTVSRALF